MSKKRYNKGMFSNFNGKTNRVSKRHRMGFLGGIGKSFFSNNPNSRSSRQGQSGRMGL